MATATRFGKPNMTNLPSELGVAIFKQIMSTPAPDRDKMHAEARRLEKEMLKVRLKEDAQGDSSK